MWGNSATGFAEIPKTTDMFEEFFWKTQITDCCLKADYCMCYTELLQMSLYAYSNGQPLRLYGTFGGKAVGFF